MKACQVLLALITVILVNQVRSQDMLEFGAISSKVFVPFGEAVWLNCSTPKPDQTFYESRLYKNQTKRGPNWLAVQVIVNDWENSTCFCMLDTRNDIFTSHTIVMAYALPSDVTIDLLTELEEGKEYTINCMVHEVAPLEYLTIYISRGGDVIHTKSYEGLHVVNRRTVSHLHTFTAWPSDNFMTFSCEAILQLGSEVHTVKSTEITVQTYMRSQDMLEFGAISSEVFVPFGEAVWLNCSTPKPDQTFYESRLYKNQTKRGPNWLAVQVIVNDWENSTCVCMLDTGDEIFTSHTQVMSYALPSDITIDLQTELEEGKEYTINCTVHEVAPLEYLTINISRGGDVIDSKSYEGPHVVNRRTMSHLHTFTACRSDNLMKFSCEAVLLLGSEIHTAKSTEITVQTYMRSQDMLEFGAISSEVFVPFGEAVWLNCSTPKPDQTFYESRLYKNQTKRGPNWLAVQVIVNDWENSTCVCMLDTGDEIFTSHTQVMSYALPSDVTIDLQTELEEGKEYTINCTVHEVAPLEYLTINISRGGDVIDTKSYEGPHVVNRRTVSHLHTFTAHHSENLKDFFCEAILRLGSEIHTVKSTEITVQTYMRSQDTLEFGAIHSEVFIQLGEAVWLNCSTPKPYRTLYDTRLYKNKVERGPNWLAVQVIVRDWESSTCVCVLDKGDEFLTSDAIVMAYALPSDVTIDLQTELEEGKEYTINCTVHEVAPLEYLTINISRGGDVIDTKSYEGPHVVNRRTVSHLHTFTARRSDNLKDFSCEAILRLGSEIHTVKSTEITVQTYMRSQDTLEFGAISSEVFVPFGEAVWLKCFTPKPSRTFYDSRLYKKKTKRGPNWLAVQVIVRDWESSTCVCVLDSGDIFLTSHTQVMAYTLPSDVTIDLPTELEEGKEYTINCTVYEVAPLEYLTINISRGGNVIDTKSYEGPHVVNRRTVSHLHTFIAHRSDNLMKFSCEAILRLGSEVHPAKSMEITVQTYMRPQDMDFGAISSEVFVPLGEAVWLNCSTPKPDQTYYDSRLYKNQIKRGPNWLAVQVIVRDWESSTCVCMLDSGDESLTSQTQVMAYALPSDVTIDLPTELEEGKEYTINCTVHEVAPLEYLTINISRGGDVIDTKSYEGPHVVNRRTVSHLHTFTAHRSDNLKDFSCEAVLLLGSEVHTVKSREITVQTYTDA